MKSLKDPDMTNTEWFWRIVDADGLADLPSDEREALSILCRRLQAAELRASNAEEREARRADELQEVVAALYNAWPDAEDMATDWPLGIIGRVEDLIAERDAARKDRDELVSVAARWTGRAYVAEEQRKALVEALEPVHVLITAIAQTAAGDWIVNAEDPELVVCSAHEAVQRAALSETLPKDDWRPTHRHVKRGTLYRLVSSAVLQTGAPVGDNEFLALYQGEDGLYWVRPADEFKDGRFEPLPAPPTTTGEGE
jgi:hypothetical protein